MGQEVRFCTARDGTRIAYAVHGQGPPLVRTATWLTHLEYDWESPVWKHWLAALGETHTFLRYDERGCGLSDRDVQDFSLDTRVGDLEAVIDAAGFERCALLGMSQGGPVAIAYAARHAERVSQLVLFATYARGRLKRDPSPAAREQAKLMISLIRMGWGRDDPVFRRLYTTLFMPDATADEMAWFDELQRVTTDPETAVLIRNARNDDEVTDTAKLVSTPTLVLHARDDALAPYSEGRLLATLIPGARFVPLDSRNHVLLAREPAWQAFRREVEAFLDDRRADRPGHPGRPARPQQPRARRPRARRRRPRQRRDRRAAAHQRAHGRAPPLQRLREAAPLGQGGTGGGRRALRVCRHPAAREVGWWRRWRREPAAITSRP